MPTLVSFAPAARRHRLAGRRPCVRWSQVAIAAVVGVVAFWWVRGSLIDDAYITLDYARSLATELHWGLIEQSTANSATSPLNVALIALATSVLRVTGGIHPVAGLGCLFVACFAALAWWWVRITDALRLHPLATPLGVVLTALSPFMLSAAGMEVLVAATILTGMLAMACDRRPAAFGVLSGLALLTRLDLIVFVVILVLAASGIRAGILKAAGTTVLVAAPWFVASWFLLGSAIPDTFVIKTLQGSFGGWTFAGGPLFYFDRFPAATLVSFAPAALAAVLVPVWCVLRPFRGSERMRALAPVMGIGMGGAAYYAAYSVMGVPPYQWYFVPVMSAGAIVTCAFAASWPRGRAITTRVGGGLAGVATVAVVVASVVVAVGDGVPWRTAPVFGNWATPADYARVGRQVGPRVGDAAVRAPPEIGTLAYFCHCAIVDPYADRGRTIPLIDKRIEQAGPVMGTLLRVNYLWLDRDTPPLTPKYRLVWAPGPGGGPDVWPTYSPAVGVSHLTLAPATAP